MIRQAWNAWFFKEQRVWPLVVGAALVLAYAIYDARSGGLGALSVSLLTLLGLCVLLIVSSYFIGLRRSLSKLEMITEGRASYTLTDSTIEAVSSLGAISLAWAAVAELRRYRTLILLGFRGGNYSTIPVSQIPADALAFMVERCRSAGARLTGL